METFNAIVTLCIGFLVILIPLGIVVGAILAVVMSSQKDPIKKAKLKNPMIWSFVLPILFLVVILVIWGLVSVASGGSVMK